MVPQVAAIVEDVRLLVGREIDVVALLVDRPGVEPFKRDAHPREAGDHEGVVPLHLLLVAPATEVRTPARVVAMVEFGDPPFAQVLGARRDPPVAVAGGEVDRAPDALEEFAGLDARAVGIEEGRPLLGQLSVREEVGRVVRVLHHHDPGGTVLVASTGRRVAVLAQPFVGMLAEERLPVGLVPVVPVFNVLVVVEVVFLQVVLDRAAGDLAAAFVAHVLHDGVRVARGLADHVERIVEGIGEGIEAVAARRRVVVVRIVVPVRVVERLEDSVADEFHEQCRPSLSTPRIAEGRGRIERNAPQTPLDGTVLLFVPDDVVELGAVVVAFLVRQPECIRPRRLQVTAHAAPTVEPQGGDLQGGGVAEVRREPVKAEGVRVVAAPLVFAADGVEGVVVVPYTRRPREPAERLFLVLFRSDAEVVATGKAPHGPALLTRLHVGPDGPAAQRNRRNGIDRNAMFPVEKEARAFPQRVHVPRLGGTEKPPHACRLVLRHVPPPLQQQIRPRGHRLGVPRFRQFPAPRIRPAQPFVGGLKVTAETVHPRSIGHVHRQHGNAVTGLGPPPGQFKTTGGREGTIVVPVHFPCLKISWIHCNSRV